MSTTEVDTHCACASCECELDRCAFCDEDACERAMCYACVGRALFLRVVDAHMHGG